MPEHLPGRHARMWRLFTDWLIAEAEIIVALECVMDELVPLIAAELGVD